MGLKNRLTGSRGGSGDRGILQLQEQVKELQRRAEEQQAEIDELRADSLRIAELRMMVEERLLQSP